MKWLRLYSDVLDDPKVQRLPPCLFKCWINLLCLASEGDKRGDLPSLPDIAFRLRMGEDETRDALNQLIAIGLIDVPDAETLRPHNWNGRQFVSDNVTERVRKHRRNVAESSDETLPERSSNAPDTDTEAEEEQKQPSPHELRFARFWQAYPRKEAKADARRRWLKLKPDDELTERIIQAVETHKQSEQWRREHGQYIPFPATWLNGGRWEDEVTEQGGSSGSSLRPTDYGYFGTTGWAEFKAAVRRHEIPGVTPEMVEARS